jgi:hypothetical protein
MLPFVIASEAKQSIVRRKESWIASSQELLAMTALRRSVYRGGGGATIGFFCASAATVDVPIGPCSS